MSASQKIHFLHMQCFCFSLSLVLLLSSGCTFEGSIVQVDEPSVPGGFPHGNTDIHVIPDTDSSTRSSDSAVVPGGNGTEINPDTTSTSAPDTDTHSDTGIDSFSGSDVPTDWEDTATDTDSGGTPGSDDADTDTDTGEGSPVTDATFSFFSLADMQDRPYVGENHIRSMAVMDPDAIALIEVGDFSHYGSESEWESHMEALKNGAVAAGYPEDYFRTTAVDWGDYIRLVGAVGNHEHWSSDWYTYWNRYLPGQQNLGVNSESQGVYFTLEYANTLLIILDSNFSNPEQTEWLKNVLEGPQAQFAKWKVAFFHESVYPCNSKPPLSFGLSWVELFEKHKVDLVVHGHAHTFERTCPMKGGKCARGNQHGVIYLTASGGGTSYLRTVRDTGSGSVTYNDRTDTYECSEILADYDSGWQHFCHYTVGDCELNIRCYDHDYWDEGLLQHEFSISKCK